MDSFEMRAHGIGLVITRTLGRKEKWQLQQRWRETFCVRLKNAHGAWTAPGWHDWRTFSDGFAPALSGARAVEAYASEPQTAVWLVPEADEHGNGFLSQSPPYAVLRGLAEFNVYVIAENLSWTLAVPFDIDWYGPFFSRREWQAEENLAESTADARCQSARERMRGGRRRRN